MLKRAFPLFLLSLLLIPLTAHAIVGPRLITKDWYFHNNRAALFYSQGDSQSVYRGTGIRASAEQADTLADMAWEDWNWPGPLFGTTVAADTVGMLLVDVYPVGTSVTVGADTLGVQLQVSNDNGSTWTTTAWTGPRIDPDAATMLQSAWLETGTSNSFHVVIRCAVGGAVAGGFFPSNTGPLAYQTYGFNKFRLILVGDHTGIYRARVTGWANE